MKNKNFIKIIITIIILFAISLESFGQTQSTTLNEKGAEETLASPNGVTADFGVSPKNVSFGALGGSEVITVSSPTNWTVNENLGWISVTPTIGFGNGSFTITSAVAFGDAASGIVTVSYGGVTDTITVTLEGEPSLGISPTTISSNSDSGSADISVFSNASWTVSSNVGWITTNPSDGFKSGSFSVSYTENQNPSSRSGEVYVTSGEVTRTLNVTQSGSAPYLTISPSSSINPNSNSGNTNVSVSSNVNWTVSDNASWITVSPTSGSNNGSFTVSYSGNTSTSSRTGKVTVSGGGISRELTVNQSGNPNSLSVSPSSLTFQYYKESKTVNVSSNISWSVSASSWLTVIPINSSGNGSIIVKNDDYFGSIPRTGSVTVEAGDESRTIFVEQNPGPYDYPDIDIIKASPSSGFQTAPASGTVYYSINQAGDVDVSINGGPWPRPLEYKLEGEYSFPFSNLGEGTHTFIFTLINSKGTDSDTLYYEVLSKTLSVDPTDITIPYHRGEFDLNITSNTSWTLSSNKIWLEIDEADAQGSGNATVTVKHKDYFGSIPQTGSLTLSGEGVSPINIFVEQNPGPQDPLDITVNPSDFDPLSGTQTAPVSGTVDYTINQAGDVAVKIDGDLAPLIYKLEGTHTYPFSDLGEGTHTFEFIFSNSKGTDSDTLSYEVLSKTLTVDPTDITVPYYRGEFDLNITSNISWKLSTNDDWLEINAADTSGPGNAIVTVKYKEYFGALPQTGNITLSGEGVSAINMIVNQNSGPQDAPNIIADPLSFNPPSGTQSPPVSGTVDYTINQAGDVTATTGSNSYPLGYKLEGTHPYAFSNLEEGVHTFEFTLNNSKGTDSDTVDYEVFIIQLITIERFEPNLGIEPAFPKIFYNAEPGSLKVYYKETSSSTFLIDGQKTHTGGAGEYTMNNPLIAGIYDIKLEITNSGGTDTVQATYTVTSADWAFNPNEFQYTANITAKILKDGVELSEAVLGAFNGEECRGWTDQSSQDNHGNKLYFLTVYLNEASESINLIAKVKDVNGNCGAPILIEPSITLDIDEIMGTITGPILVSVNGSFEVSGVVQKTGLQPLEGIKINIVDGTPSPNPVALNKIAGISENYVFTDSLGNYDLELDYNWNGLLIPEDERFNFDPDTIAIDPLVKDQVSKNFAAAVNRYTISGYVVDENLLPQENVNIYFIGTVDTTVITDISGYYECEFEYGWVGEAKVNKSGFNSTPQSHLIDTLKNNLQLTDFLLEKKELTLNHKHILTNEIGDTRIGFGNDVKIYENLAFISAPTDYDGSFRGAVHVYEFVNGDWNYITALRPNVTGLINFGCVLDYHNNFLVVGATKENDYTGAVYVFHFDGISWSLLTKLLGSNSKPADYFGSAVSIENDLIVVSAPHGNDNRLGAIYIFEYDGNNWNEVQKVVPQDQSYVGFGNFGRSIDINGDFLMIGDYKDFEKDDNVGAVYVFKKINNVWTEVSKLFPYPNIYRGVYFGESISTFGDYLVVGAPSDFSSNGKTGQIYIFRNNNNNWEFMQSIYPSDGIVSQDFGNSVDIYGNYIVVGGPGNYKNNNRVYVYKLENNTWTEFYKFDDPSYDSGDYLGRSVAISNLHVMIGNEKGENSDEQGSVVVLGDIWNYNPKLISGLVKDNNNIPLSDVVIDYGDGIINTTGSDGVFQRYVEKGWSGNIKPSLFSYKFSPRNFEINNIQVNNSGLEFTGNFFESNFTNEIKITHPEIDYGDYFGNSVDIYEDWVIVGCPRGQISTLNKRGFASVYKFDNGNLEFKYDIYDNNSNVEHFGYAVAITENYAMVGNYLSKVVSIFDINDSTWTLSKRISSTSSSYSNDYGDILDISKNIAVYSDNEFSNYKGLAFFYERSGNNWDIAYTVKGEDDFDHLGISVAASENYSAVGSPYNEDGSYDGSVYIYKKNGSSFTFMQELKHPTRTGNKYFGWSIDITDKFLIVGAKSEYSGAAYIFENVNDEWVYRQRLAETGTDDFGVTVSIANLYAVVGEKSRRRNAKCFIYKYDGNTWNWHKTVAASDGFTDDYYGYDLAISDYHLVVGAKEDDDMGSSSGSVYIYTDEVIQQQGSVAQNFEEELQFSIDQNYPNPFNPTTEIKYSIKEDAMVKVKIYDILGRQVEVLVNHFQEAGQHKAIFNASKFASGIYFYTIEAGGFRKTKKMILMR